MATTFTALMLAEGRAHVFHVGDSRAYRFAAGRLDQLTHDHLADLGGPVLCLDHALGFDARLHIDHLALDLHPGERLLLCTDGLHGALPARRIATILARTRAPMQAAKALRDAALAAGGDDNITAVVLDVLTVPAPAAQFSPVRE
jgi:serine/threonine protein phosphatase PrpC